MKRIGLFWGLMLLLLLGPAATALADGPIVTFDGGQIFVDEDVSLAAGQSFNGDLGIWRGDLTMAAGSVVNGDLFVASGNAYIAGRVNGSLAILNGHLELTSSGYVTGDVVGIKADQDVAGQVEGSLSALVGDIVLRNTALVRGDLLVTPGHIRREAGARVLGSEVYDLDLPPLPFLGKESPEVPAPSQIPTPSLRPWEVPQPRELQREPWRFGVRQFLGRVMAAAFLSLLSIGIGMLVAVIWPRPTRRVSDCILALPAQSFGLGLLTFLIAAGLEAIAAVLVILVWLVATALVGTVILIPLGLLLILLAPVLMLPIPIALAGAMILGWVGLADLIGHKVLKLFNVAEVKPLGAALVGLLIMVAVTALLWIVKPLCCAWPFVILVSSVGLGAAIHTRFGRQSCRSAAPPGQPEALPPEAMDIEAGQPDVPVS